MRIGDKPIDRCQICARLPPARTTESTDPVSPLLGTWHLLGLVVPALIVGGMTALFAKWLWHRELRAAPLLRLGITSCAASVLGCGACLALLRQDGAMAAYAVMVACSALSVAWSCGRPRSG